MTPNKHPLCILSISVLLTLISLPPLNANPQKKRLAKKIQKIFQRNLKSFLKERRFAYAFSLRDAQSNTSIAAHDEKRMMIPASNLKLLTTLVAFTELGPEYRFYTRASVDKTIRGSNIKQAIIIQSNGNPVFTNESMLRLVMALKSRGIDSISGDIFLDGNFFSPPAIAVKNNDGHSNPYNAPNSAIALNFNTLEFTISPQRHNQPCRIVTTPINPLFTLVNRCKTGRGTATNTLEITRKQIAGKQEHFTITGTIGDRASPRIFYRYTNHPFHYFAAGLQDFLHKVGITFTGSFHFNKPQPSNPDRVKIAEIKSPPLSDILRDMNKYSTNFTANQVLLALGRKAQPPPIQTHKAGITRLNKFLSTKGIPAGEFNLVDGSGLDIENRLSTRTIVEILYLAGRNFQFSAEFIASLPIYGIDGTLKNAGHAAHTIDRLIRAKTGTIRKAIDKKGRKRNAMAISGLLYAKKPYMFSILFNDFKNAQRLRAKQHNILKEILSTLSDSLTLDDAR